MTGSTGPTDPVDVVVLGELLVTTPARTAADLGRTLCRPDALAALDQLVARSRIPRLTRCLPSSTDSPGTAA